MAERNPDVTIVMVPRERFSFTERAVESLYQDQSVPFKFICVDGGSPPQVRDYLQEQSQRRNFTLIRTHYYLLPNEARNLAFDQLDTKYTVFTDNDVVFEPGWLQKLVACAEETGAAVVSPLICYGENPHEIIHIAGGDSHIYVKDGKRALFEQHHLLDRRLADVKGELVRKQTELAEFHGMIVRTDMLKKLGRFDEKLKTTSEHADFSMMVREQGGTIMLEPDSIVTQLFVNSFATLSDLNYFFFRWNRQWSVDSELHFHKKWNLVWDDAVLEDFVRHRRRCGLYGFYLFVKSFAGWRISEWVHDRVADLFVIVSKYQRASALRKSAIA